MHLITANRYKPMLCTTKVYVGTDYIVNLDLHVRCQPQKYYNKQHFVGTGLEVGVV